MNLYEYAETEPLRVEERVEIVVMGSILGWAGPSNRDVATVVTHRHRHRYDGGKQDFMRKYQGYCYGDRTLDILERKGVKRIAVLEVDNDRIVEYKISQFRDSTTTVNDFEDQGGLSYCVPLEDAIHTWDRDECEIIDNHR